MSNCFTMFAVLCLTVSLAACASLPSVSQVAPTTVTSTATSVSTPPPTATPIPTTPAPTVTLAPTTPAPTATSAQTAPSAAATASGDRQPPLDIAAQVDALMNKYVAAHLFSGSVHIAHNGTVLISKGYGLADQEQKIPNTPQIRFSIASLTKQFTAMAVLQLQQQGKLQVQDSVCRYVPDCPTAWQGMTIHQLLTHTAGVPDLSDADFQALQPTPNSFEQLIAKTKSKPLDFQPGSKWSYSNAGYMILALIIEGVSGTSYPAFLQKSIFAPLHMNDTGYVQPSDKVALGYDNSFSKAAPFDPVLLYGAAGLFSTTEDLYRWSQALSTTQLVSQKLLDQMFTPFASALPVGSAEEPGGAWYGYGWGITKRLNRRMAIHEGIIRGYHSLVERYLDDKVSIILLSNQNNTELDDIGKALAPIIFNEK
ncbi:MAG: beta-lactamase family protein [Herpetosiphonaceae bacterium]|nr:beta-lactamase family protein [Herpetosiphonaceae bacterium]